MQWHAQNLFIISSSKKLSYVYYRMYLLTLPSSALGDDPFIVFVLKISIAQLSFQEVTFIFLQVVLFISTFSSLAWGIFSTSILLYDQRGSFPPKAVRVAISDLVTNFTILQQLLFLLYFLAVSHKLNGLGKCGICQSRPFSENVNHNFTRKVALNWDLRYISRLG